MKRITIILLSILLLSGCNNVLPTKKEKEVKHYTLMEGANLTINKEIEVFDEVYLKDIVDTNITFDKNIMLDTNTIGKQEIDIKYSFEDKEDIYTLRYTVHDNVKPIFLNAAQTRTILINDDTNLCDSINIADNYSRVPTCEIDGEYNIEEAGIYNVNYLIKDEAGNTNTRKLTVKVVNELPVTPDPEPQPDTHVDFDYVINKFKTSNTEIGIDVSRWQGDIDYDAVREAGATFVMMRLGVSNKPEEELAVDSKFKQNIQNAKAAGLKVGVYVYTAAINEDMAKTLANFIIDTLDGEKLDFPVVFDWENWSKFRSYKISIHDINNVYLTFDKEMKKHNLDTMLYSSKYYLEIIWDDKVKNEHPVWLAHYTNNKSSYTGDYMMWQMCSDGRIDGIKGDVDIDVLFK